MTALGAVWLVAAWVFIAAVLLSAWHLTVRRYRRPPSERHPAAGVLLAAETETWLRERVER